MSSDATPISDKSVEGGVLVIGVFDLFHRGHLELLKKAAGLGETLNVIVNGDDFTERYKRRPVIPESDRLEVVRSIRWVTNAVVSNTNDVKPWIERFNVKAIVHGDDWDHLSYLEQICVDEVYLTSNAISMVYVPYYDGTSTSRIIKYIQTHI